MRRFTTSILALVLAVSCTDGGGTAPADEEAARATALAEELRDSGEIGGVGGLEHAVREGTEFAERFRGVLEEGVEYHAVIELEKGGEIEIVFFPEVAPNHVANFVSLARAGYYDGVTFHRVIPNFMAQGGDPTGTGAGGPGYTVDAEFSELHHRRGTLSMARTPDPNSAGSQFFICYGDCPFLDGQYTIFGEVTGGMDVVDSIRPRDPQSNPTFTGDAMRTVRIVEVRPEEEAPDNPSGDEGAGE